MNKVWSLWCYMIDAPRIDSEREAIHTLWHSHRKMGKMLKCYSILLLQNQRIRNNQRHECCGICCVANCCVHNTCVLFCDIIFTWLQLQLNKYVVRLVQSLLAGIRRFVCTYTFSWCYNKWSSIYNNIAINTLHTHITHAEMLGSRNTPTHTLDDDSARASSSPIMPRDHAA